MNLTIETTLNGNLQLSVDEETAEEIKYQRKTLERGWWEIAADLFEEHSCNGSYTLFDAGQANPYVGITAAPCIAEVMNTDDDGNNKVEGHLWFDKDYMILDFLETLATKHTYIFYLAT